MAIGLPKLILIIIISVAVLALLGAWIKETFFKEKGLHEGLPEEIKEMVANMPSDTPSLTEEQIKKNSGIWRSRKEISQFVIGFYDENQGGFKMEKDSPVGLEATYYGVQTLRGLENLSMVENSAAMLDKIRSYYTSPGYYEEQEKDPVFSTGQALVIDRWYQEDLGKTIDLTWLKSNSLESKSLESDKFDPEYQTAVIEIYRHLETAEKLDILEELSYPYFDYYCSFCPPEDIADSDYLRQKYYQIFLIANFSGLENIESLTGNCFKEEDIEADKERLGQIQLKELNDIKEIYWLYYLQKFYNFSPDLKEVLKRIGNFYSEKGFKENLTDSEPGLIGTYYGTLFVK